VRQLRRVEVYFPPLVANRGFCLDRWGAFSLLRLAACSRSRGARGVVACRESRRARAAVGGGANHVNVGRFVERSVFPGSVVGGRVETVHRERDPGAGGE